MSAAPTWRVSRAVADRFPGLRVVVVHAHGLAAGPSDDVSRAWLADAAERAQVALDALRVTRPADHPHLAAWRAAYSAFGAKPSRYPCSAEALASRALKTGLPAIGRVVDAYNAVSVAHLVPVGGEDLAAVAGDQVLRFADGDEPFDAALSDDVAVVVEHPAAGEVVWADREGVTCRRWNWRQGVRTRITDATVDAGLVLEALPGLEPGALDAAVAELTARLRDLGAEVRVADADVVDWAGHA